MKEETHLPPCAAMTRVITWLLVVCCATGCATAFDRTPATEPLEMTGLSSLPPRLTHEEPVSANRLLPAPKETDRNTPEIATADSAFKQEYLIEPTWLSSTGQGGRGTASCHWLSDSRDSSAGDRPCQMMETQLFYERPLGNDLPLRPPLRQTWFHHPRLIPLGDDSEFELPDGSVLAHRDRVSSRPFRNSYAGFRDQPILHRDSSRDPFTDSTLPEIGPPPPHHAAKTVTTLLGGVFLGFAAYAFLPSSFTGATKEGAVEEAWEHFQNAWTKPPVIDKDRAVVNYLGHPYFGMSFYLTQRNFGESPLRSFLFSTAMSTAFEYFVESWAERPSIQDLIITPIVGSILGELVFRATQEMRKDGFTTAEKIAVTVINPLYVLQNGYR